ncbi:MAG: TIGR03087 family PEP-CTERM/XrtA system glycosyltransferase [Phycisphaerae bacterium]
MNILYLAHRIPFPPDKGDKMRSFRQIEHLAKAHRVYCACFVDRAADTRHVEHLATYCEEIAAIRLRPASAALHGVAGLLCGGTITGSYYCRAAMRSLLQRWSRRRHFDAVVAFSSGMAPYALDIPAPRRVLDLCDLDSRKWKDYAAASDVLVAPVFRAEGRRLAERERSWINAFDATMIITEMEAEPLQGKVDARKLHVVGNGVTLPPSPTTRRRTPQTAHAPPTVGFVGTMNYRPNVDAVCWFAKECWPIIRGEHPTAVFRIIGRWPTRAIRALGTQDGVEVIGEVDDIHAELRRLDVSVAPMRIARGLQNKVLEAMSARKPVVLTSVPAAAIGARHERECLVADSPVDIAAAAVRLLQEPALRARLGRTARRFVACRYQWDEALRRFEWIVTGVKARQATRSTTDRPHTAAARPLTAGAL